MLLGASVNKRPALTSHRTPIWKSRALCVAVVDIHRSSWFVKHSLPGWSEYVQPARYFVKEVGPHARETARECRRGQWTGMFESVYMAASSPVCFVSDFGYARSLARPSASTGTEDERRNATCAAVDSVAETVGPASRGDGQGDGRRDGGEREDDPSRPGIVPACGISAFGNRRDHGRKKWQVQADRNQPGLSFAFDEAIALYLARHLMEPLAGTMFWDAVQRAFRKIRATLGPQAIKYVGQFGAMFHQTKVGASDYTKKSELIDELMIGIEDRGAVFITYQSLRATEPVTYDIYPYGLAYHRGSLYLIGFAPDHREIRHWKVDRMEDAEVTPVHFQRPEDFDLREHLAKSFGVFQGDGDVHVKVRFSASVARYVTESSWHSSQQLTPQKDGSLLAEFDLGHTEEIKRWIQSFGKHAVVLEPEQLRAEIIDELNALRVAYSTSGNLTEDVGGSSAANPSAMTKGRADERRKATSGDRFKQH